MKTLFVFVGMLFIAFIAYSGKPLADVTVQVEDLESGDLIASQRTNKQGEVVFAKLGKGTYRLVVILVKQDGKYRDKKEKNYRVAYHSTKRMYMLQEPIGFFVFKYSGLKNLANSTITPMYETEQIKNNQLRHNVGKFEVKGKQGGLTINMEALTSRKFNKTLEQIKNDPELILVTRVKKYSFFGKKVE